MALFSRQKFVAALIAGCTAAAVNSVSLAAEAADTAAVPAVHQEMAADFDKATLPADPGKALYEKHLHHMMSDYSWMTQDTAKRAAMAFTAIDKAVKAGKINDAQAASLQKAVIDFYQENKSYAEQLAKLSGDEAKAYKTDCAEFLQLNKNIDRLSKQSGVDDAVIEDILSHPQKVQPGSRDQRASAFLGQLVKQQKLTSDEANAMIAFMTKSHENFAKMNDEQRQAYKEKVQAMSEDQRYEEMSNATGISVDRLKEIFAIMKQEIKTQVTVNQKTKDSQQIAQSE